MPKKIAKFWMWSWEHKNVLGKIDILNKVLTLTYPIIEDWKLVQAMTLEDACKEVWITWMTLRNWRKQDPMLEDKWQNVMEARRELMKNYAEDTIDKALRWTLKLRPTDKVNTAFRLLEKTDKAYQPKQQLEVKSMNMDFNMSIEEMEAKIKDLYNN